VVTLMPSKGQWESWESYRIERAAAIPSRYVIGCLSPPNNRHYYHTLKTDRGYLLTSSDLVLF